MPILGTIASSFRSGTTGVYESIATVTLTSSGNISFSNIPQTYKHLELRGNLQLNAAFSYFDSSSIAFNGDTTTTNYWRQQFVQDGSTIQGYTGNNRAFLAPIGYSTGISNLFTPFYAHILDYTNTSKRKNIKGITGYSDGGSSGTYAWNGLNQSVWNSTNAITSIEFSYSAGFSAGSTIALYGIK